MNDRTDQEVGFPFEWIDRDSPTTKIWSESGGITLDLGIGYKTFPGRTRGFKKLLKTGVPITINSELAGHLVQKSRGFTRDQRTVQLEPTEASEWFEPGYYFRRRGFQQTSLELDGTEVIRKAGRHMHYGPLARPELAALFGTFELTLEPALMLLPDFT